MSFILLNLPHRSVEDNLVKSRLNIKNKTEGNYRSVKVWKVKLDEITIPKTKQPKTKTDKRK